MSESRRGRALRRVVSGSVLVLMTAALFAGTAGAHKQAYDSSIQLKIDALTTTSTQYSGRVNSEKAACERYRDITITTGGVFVAQVLSDAAGNYSIAVTGTPPAQGQDMVATAAKKFIKRNSKHKHKCSPASVTHKAPKPVTP